MWSSLVRVGNSVATSLQSSFQRRKRKSKLDDDTEDMQPSAKRRRVDTIESRLAELQRCRVQVQASNRRRIQLQKDRFHTRRAAAESVMRLQALAAEIPDLERAMDALEQALQTAHRQQIPLLIKNRILDDMHRCKFIPVGRLVAIKRDMMPQFEQMDIHEKDLRDRSLVLRERARHVREQMQTTQSLVDKDAETVDAFTKQVQQCISGGERLLVAKSRHRQRLNECFRLSVDLGVRLGKEEDAVNGSPILEPAVRDD